MFFKASAPSPVDYAQRSREYNDCLSVRAAALVKLHNKRQQMRPVYKLKHHSAVEPVAVHVMRVASLSYLMVYN